jgi:hypothetical protein
MASDDGSDVVIALGKRKGSDDDGEAPSPDDYSLDDGDVDASRRCCRCLPFGGAASRWRGGADGSNGNEGSVELVNVIAATSYLGSPKAIMCKFVIFSVSFSLVHACVTGVLSYAQVFFPSVAQDSIATMYGVFTGTALLLATILVEWATYKYALFFSLVMYCLYVASYAVGGAFREFEVPIIMTGAVVGGLAAGVLWTAQGPYFKAFAVEVRACVANCGLVAAGAACAVLRCVLACNNNNNNNNTATTTNKQNNSNNTNTTTQRTTVRQGDELAGGRCDGPAGRHLCLGVPGVRSAAKATRLSGLRRRQLGAVGGYGADAPPHAVPNLRCHRPFFLPWLPVYPGGPHPRNQREAALVRWRLVA